MEHQKQGILARGFKGLLALTFLGVLVGGTSLLYLRANANTVDFVERPLPVSVIIARASPGYDVTERFIGTLEPARETVLAFERGGLVSEVTVEEGDQVAAGDVVAVLDTSLLDAQRDELAGQKAQIEANLSLSLLTEDRQRFLKERGHVSVQRLDEARFATAAIRGQLKAIKASLTMIDITIAKSSIKAPFDGTIAARRRDEGAVVEAGVPIVELLETGSPQARIGLSGQAASALAVGDAVTLSVNGSPLVGTVKAIRPDLTSATRTTPVLVELPKNVPAPIGETVTMEVTRQIDDGGFWLPLAALMEGERGLWSVLTLEGNDDNPSRLQREVVELLHVESELAYVRGTLQEGARVVSKGRNRVIPGQLVSLASIEEVTP